MTAAVKWGQTATPERSRSPVRCVCDLCDCGSHDCSSLLLRPASELTQADNRWQGRMSAVADAEPESGVAPLEFSSSTCLCDAQRYLTAPVQRRSQSSTSNAVNSRGRGRKSADQEEEEEEELLHVLVTRPEIAGKPRDNILFEGDMDLKTTFETSYEALAKMRLDCWKKHQNVKGSQKAQGVSKEPTTVASRKRRSVSQVREVGQVEEARRKEGDKEVSSGRIVESGGATPVQPELTQKAARPQEAVPSGSSSKQAPLVDSESHKEPSRAGQSSPASALRDDFIDPDLSPIIVYDANMNRLERVGMRKRSKYRPSTSLRSGSHGLFGDQEPQAEEVSDRRVGEHPNRGHQLQDAAKPHTSTQRNAAGSASKQQELKRNLNKTTQVEGLIFTERNLQVGSKRRVVGNVNLVDHIKEQDIVESRGRQTHLRQRRDISQQVSSSPVAETAIDDYELMVRDNLENVKLADMEEADAVREIQRVANAPTVGVRDSADQRPRGQTNAAEAQASPALFYAGKTSSSSMNTTNGSEDRQTMKLQRTCQNQNFCLSENNYPEARQEHDRVATGRASRGLEVDEGSGGLSQSSPQPAQVTRLSYNNLFRESPDFIMTTGKFLESEAKQVHTKSDTDIRENATGALSADISKNGPDSQNQNLLTKDELLVDTECAEDQVALSDGNMSRPKGPARECRVFKLDEDFQYIGSDSGHKYFVEKESSKKFLEYE